jgi:hypothetical protein
MATERLVIQAALAFSDYNMSPIENKQTYVLGNMPRVIRNTQTNKMHNIVS